MKNSIKKLLLTSVTIVGLNFTSAKAGELLPGEITLPACVGTAPICLVQAFSFNIGYTYPSIPSGGACPTNTQQNTLKGLVSFVWSTCGYGSANAPTSNSIFGAYWALGLNNSGVNGYSVTYFQTYYPSWVLYLQNGTTPAWHGGVVRDINNVLSSSDPTCGSSGNLICINTSGRTNNIYSASFTGSISGNTLTASSVTGYIGDQAILVGAGLATGMCGQTGAGTPLCVNSQISGTPGGAGTYSLNQSGSIGSEAMTSNTQVTTSNIVGVPGANVSLGTVTVYDNTHFTINGSTFSGVYVTGTGEASWSGNTTSVPLDFQNPNVVNFFESYLYNFVKVGGYANLGNDIANVTNNDSAYGHYIGTPTGSCVGAPNTCGMIFHQDFPGTRQDPTYEEAILNFSQTLTNYSHSLGVFNIGNVADVGTTQEYPITPNSLTASYQQQMSASFDINAQEGLFINCRNSPCSRLANMNFAFVFQTDITLPQEKGWWSVAYLNSTVGAAQTYPADQNMALSAYLMFKDGPLGPPSYFSPIGWPVDHGYYVSLYKTWFPSIGNPVNIAYQLPQANGPYSYERIYTNGQIEINASDTAASSYSVPSGSHWDSNCNTISSGTNWLALNSDTIVTASFTASISANTMTVTGSPTGTLVVGQIVTIAGGTNAMIVAYGTGTGGAGTYILNGPSQSISSEAMTSTNAGQVNSIIITNSKPPYC